MERQNYAFSVCAVLRCPQRCPNDVTLGLKIAHGVPKFIDAPLRLESGGSSCPDDDAHLRDAWSQSEVSLPHALHALGSPTAHERRKCSPLPLLHKRPPRTKSQNTRKRKMATTRDTAHALRNRTSSAQGQYHAVRVRLPPHAARAQCSRLFLPTRTRAVFPCWVHTHALPPAAPRRDNNNNGAGAGA
ncbi:hypothetical protein EDB89DRAFT_1527916 [Lactarius sanguifluus]|nr:hypothetical protein EDB89DRAFT_1527916 [Lactarius sanguifluus]